MLNRGRYDLRRTPAENINLPPALLSRFDLLWLILDKADMDNDLEMARHVVYVHQNRESPALGFAPLEASVLRYFYLSFFVNILCSSVAILIIGN